MTDDKEIPANVYWYNLKNPRPSQQLSTNLEVDCAIIGGGMAGLACAQKLQAAGQSVAIIEKDFCGSGASGRTSGFITPDSEIELSSLLETYGPQKARRIWEFIISGVECIRQNIEQHKISCDYQKQDSLFVANHPRSFAQVNKEYAARTKLGYISQLLSKPEMKTVLMSDKYAGAVRYPDTFGINSYLYCQAIKEILRANGVQIFEQTPANLITDHRVATPNGSLIAKQIFVCADRFIPEFGYLKQEIYHVQTFLGISKPLAPLLVKKIFPNDQLMVWDTDIVYNYFRLTGDNRLLIGGGDVWYTYAQHAITHTKRFARRLGQYIHYKFPELDFEIEYLWPGLLGVSKDLLPVMGTDPKNKNVWYIGAATGLPWAAALGNYAAEHWLSNRHEFDADFSPNRHFVIGPRLQSLLTTPVTYAVSHGIAKYL